MELAECQTLNQALSVPMVFNPKTIHEGIFYSMETPERNEITAQLMELSVCRARSITWIRLSLETHFLATCINVISIYKDFDHFVISFYYLND